MNTANPCGQDVRDLIATVYVYAWSMIKTKIKLACKGRDNRIGPVEERGSKGLIVCLGRACGEGKLVRGALREQHYPGQNVRDEVARARVGKYPEQVGTPGLCCKDIVKVGRVLAPNEATGEEGANRPNDASLGIKGQRTNEAAARVVGENTSVHPARAKGCNDESRVGVSLLDASLQLFGVQHLGEFVVAVAGLAVCGRVDVSPCS
jgi:hypothetical protein